MSFTSPMSHVLSNYMNIELTYLFVSFFIICLHFGLRYTIVCMFFALRIFIILHRHCRYCIKIQCLDIFSYHIQQICFFSLLVFIFPLCSLNLSFSEVEYKAFIRLLFGFTSVLLHPTPSLVSMICPLSIHFHIFFQCVYFT